MRSGTLLGKIWQVVTAALCAALVAPPGYAAIQQLNVVGVGVHKRNEVAEQIAVEYAKKRAVFMLAQKWNVPDAANRIAALNPEVFEEAVRGVNVLKLARDGDVLYVNTEVSIQDIPLKRALGLPVEDTPPENEAGIKRRGILVIPVFLPEEGVSPVVWGDGNPLIAPIKSLLLKHGRGALVLPVGDREDRSELDYDNVLRVNYNALKILVERYGVKEVLQAVVTPGKADAPTRILMMRMLPGETRPELVELAAQPGDSLAKRMQAAADTIARFAAGVSTATAEFERAEWQRLPQQKMQLNFTTMQEFGRLERALKAAPKVAQVHMSDIALQRVHAVVYTDATDEALRRYFDKQGIRWQKSGDMWVISYR